MRFLSVCSGIEAASVAWAPLGWQAAAVAEIDPFACALLAARHGASRPAFMPDPAAPGVALLERRKRVSAIKAVARIPAAGRVPNFGNLEAWKDWPDATVDILVGGTPCQSFSVAGLRKGLDDPRGNLALVYLAVADRYRPRWIVWENVPGVLSSGKGRDFGAFLGGLAELGYGWAYRILDAQYVRTRLLPGAVPQRRRRVFVVGYLGDWRRAAAVLFDAESLQRNPPPRRWSGQSDTYDVAPCLAASGRGFDRPGDTRGQDCLIPQVSGALAARDAKFPRAEDNVGIIAVAHALRAEGFDASEDGTGRGTPIVPVAPTLRAGGNITGGHRPFGTDVDTCDSLIPIPSQRILGLDPIFAIQERAVSENPAAGPDGAGFRQDGAAYTMEARTQVQAVAFAENSRAEIRLMGGDGQVVPQLTTGGGKPGQGQPVVAFDLRGREGGAMPEGPHDTANIRAGGGGSSRSYLAMPWAVRRLTPIECERLQGFPDGYTDVPYLGKNRTADAPRYKALGNSMAVNVMNWLGERILLVDSLPL